MTELAPVAKLDAAAAIAGIQARTGIRLELLGSAVGGQVGAAYVRWPDGRDGVLTGGPPVAESERTAGVLALARERGLPVPAYQLIADLDDTVVLVQERLPGRKPDRVDRPLVEKMVAINEKFAGLLAARTDVPAPDLYLDHSGPGFCVHESLEIHSDRSRRLLGWIREVGRSGAMTGDDLVHLDFHPENVLVDDDGEITGVIDWDVAARGDRTFALVTLQFSLPYKDDWLDRQIVGDALRLYYAHMSLRMVDWAIRHFPPPEVDRWLGQAEAVEKLFG